MKNFVARNWLTRGSWTLVRLIWEKTTSSRYQKLRWEDLPAYKFFFTFHTRPKSAEHYPTHGPLQSVSREKMAIVLQGPVVKRDDLTLETLKLYAKRYPTVDVILSTWSGYELEDIKLEINRDGIQNIKFISNALPANFGIGNANLQTVSSSSGIDLAAQAGAKYVLKTRTDQRICSPTFLEFFRQLVATFPPTHGNRAQGSRIVALSLGTLSHRTGTLSDFMQFGATEEMRKFWSADTDKRNLDDIPEGPKTAQEWSKDEIQEVYFYNRYLRRLGLKPNLDLKHWWTTLKDYFIIIDPQMIDFIWPKYSYREYRHESYESVDSHAEIRFNQWLIWQNCEPVPQESDLNRLTQGHL